MDQQLNLGIPVWRELLPLIFSDQRFHKSNGSSRRYQISVHGVRAGIVIAWRPDNYANYALNKADLDRLLELGQNGSFTAVFVVIATIDDDYTRTYVGHREAEQLAAELKAVRLRKGPHGDYWLLQDGLVPVDAANDDVPF